ncbi:MAG TPA: ABC transporter ATP-binding protein [Candidatus Elarobacter sp.]|nr:ABC transporter ATP-binding protein [Candidatus Elarobacter sp.]
MTSSRPTASPEGGARVELRALAVRYPGSAAAAVHDVDLTVEAGEFAVLLGPSGCGKSTLLRTINRLVEPTSGTVLIDGVDVRAQDAVALRRGIGYVIQAVGLFPHYTVAENVAAVPGLLGWDRARIAARVDELLTLIRLDPAQYRDRRPRELSGGEAQRVGVARALAARPRVLLMDEPFAAVDAIVRASLQEEIARVHRELRTTVVFVTHDVDEALRLADRVVVMNAGHVVQTGPPDEILRHPADAFVRDLVGVDPETRRLVLERPLIER